MGWRAKWWSPDAVELAPDLITPDHNYNDDDDNGDDDDDHDDDNYNDNGDDDDTKNLGHLGEDRYSFSPLSSSNKIYI